MWQARLRRDRGFRRLTVLMTVLSLLGPLWMLSDVVRRALPALHRYELVLEHAPESLRRDRLSAPLLSDAAFDRRPEPGQPVRLMLSADVDAALKDEFSVRRQIRQSGAFVLSTAADGSVHAVGLPVPEHAVRVRIGEGMFLIVQAEGSDLVLDPVVPAAAGTYTERTVDIVAAPGRLDAKIAALLAYRLDTGAIERVRNFGFLTGNDSRQPELAGIGGALKGSLLTLSIAAALAVPAGIAAAMYAEFGLRSLRMRQRLEVATANMAAVPSVVYGLLGASVFLRLAGLPRSSPLAGGCVLAFIVMPIVLTASREALRSVPPGLLQGALALGATPMQAVLQQVLPSALPGVLTGALLGLSRAAGETAPLLMIGMAAFIADAPAGVTDASTVLPVQIYLWSNSPERGFVEKTAAAVIVLVAVPIAVNLSVLLLRRRTGSRIG